MHVRVRVRVCMRAFVEHPTLCERVRVCNLRVIVADHDLSPGRSGAPTFDGLGYFCAKTGV